MFGPPTEAAAAADEAARAALERAKASLKPSLERFWANVDHSQRATMFPKLLGHVGGRFPHAFDGWQHFERGFPDGVWR